MDSEEDYIPSVDKRTSKFNSAQLKLYRINGLWEDAHRHSRTGELQKWNWDLDRIWLELIANAENTDIDFFKEIRGMIVDCSAKGKLYHLLMEKEAFLRKLEDRTGLGNAYYDGDEDDL